MTAINMEGKVKNLMELKRMMEELQGEIAAAEDEIKAEMGNEEVLIAGAYKVTWKTVSQNRFDSTAFKKDHAELAAQYTKSSTYRRFTVN